MLAAEYKVIENYENRDTVTYLNAKLDSTVVVVSEPAEGLAMCIQENCKGLMPSCILQQLPQQQVHPFKDTWVIKVIDQLVIDQIQYTHYIPITKDGKVPKHKRHFLKCNVSNLNGEICTKDIRLDKSDLISKPYSSLTAAEKQELHDLTHHECKPEKPKNSFQSSKSTISTFNSKSLFLQFLVFISTTFISFKAACSDPFYNFIYYAMELARFDRNTPVEILFPRATRQYIQKEILKRARIEIRTQLSSLRNKFISITIDSAKILEKKLTLAMAYSPFQNRKPFTLASFIGRTTKKNLIRFGTEIDSLMKHYNILITSITTDTLRHQISAFNLNSPSNIGNFIVHRPIPYGASCVAHVLSLCYTSMTLIHKPLYLFNWVLQKLIQFQGIKISSIVVKRWLVSFDMIQYIQQNLNHLNIPNAKQLLNSTNKNKSIQNKNNQSEQGELNNSKELEQQINEIIQQITQNSGKYIQIFRPARDALNIFEKNSSKYSCVFPHIIQLLYYYSSLHKQWRNEKEFIHYQVLLLFSNDIFARFVLNTEVFHLTVVTYVLTKEGRAQLTSGTMNDINFINKKYQLNYIHEQIKRKEEEEDPFGNSDCDDMIVKVYEDDSQNVKLMNKDELNSQEMNDCTEQQQINEKQSIKIKPTPKKNTKLHQQLISQTKSSSKKSNKQKQQQLVKAKSDLLNNLSQNQNENQNIFQKDLRKQPKKKNDVDFFIQGISEDDQELEDLDEFLQYNNKQQQMKYQKEKKKEMDIDINDTDYCDIIQNKRKKIKQNTIEKEQDEVENELITDFMSVMKTKPYQAIAIDTLEEYYINIYTDIKSTSQSSSSKQTGQSSQSQSISQSSSSHSAGQSSSSQSISQSSSSHSAGQSSSSQSISQSSSSQSIGQSSSSQLISQSSSSQSIGQSSSSQSISQSSSSQSIGQSPSSKQKQHKKKYKSLLSTLITNKSSKIVNQKLNSISSTFSSFKSESLPTSDSSSPSRSLFLSNQSDSEDDSSEIQEQQQKEEKSQLKSSQNNIQQIPVADKQQQENQTQSQHFMDSILKQPSPFHQGLLIPFPKTFFQQWINGDEINHDKVLKTDGEIIFFQRYKSYEAFYPNVGDFALRLLACSSSEASCERAFAELRRIGSCHKRNMRTNTIVSTSMVIHSDFQ